MQDPWRKLAHTNGGRVHRDQGGGVSNQSFCSLVCLLARSLSRSQDPNGEQYQKLERDRYYISRSSLVASHRVSQSIRAIGVCSCSWCCCCRLYSALLNLDANEASDSWLDLVHAPLVCLSAIIISSNTVLGSRREWLFVSSMDRFHFVDHKSQSCSRVSRTIGRDWLVSPW